MGRRRGQPYSRDLRGRVLAAIGEPIRSVAARLAVSPSYVSKVQSKLRFTGEAAAGPQHNHELAKRGLSISPAGVRCVWQRHDLTTMKHR